MELKDSNKTSGWKIFWKGMRENFTWETAVVRLLMAWLVTAVLFYIETGVNFNGAILASAIHFPMYLCFMALFFAFFCGLGYFKVFGWVETYGPMLLITVYGFLTMDDEVELSYVLGLAMMLAIAITYATFKTKVFLDIKHKATVIAIYVLAALAFLGYFGCVAIFRYLTYRTPGFDFGIWVQMFHYMKETFKPLTTCERSELLSHFSVHFSPIYYLYLPIYILLPYPITLNVLQVLTILSGLIPVYCLCRKKELSRSAQAVFALIFLLYPALGCGTFYDLHENCFLVPLLLWLFYFIEKEDLKFIILFSVLTCLVKEDAPMYVACIGLYMLLSKKQSFRGGMIMIGAVLYFVIVTVLMKVFGNGVMESRFSNYMSTDSAGGMWDLIRNIVTNPAYVLSECFSTDRLTFLAQMFLPIGFLPLATKHMSRLVLLLPMVLENLASDWKYQHSVFYQYAFGVSAILIYLAIVNYAELSEKARRFMSSVALCVGILFLPMCALSKTYYFTYYASYPSEYAQLNAMVDSIPEEASVTCSAFFLPHLASRDEVYEFEYTEELTTEYVVLDLRWGKVDEDTISEVEAAGYRIVDEGVDTYVILQRKNAGEGK